MKLSNETVRLLAWLGDPDAKALLATFQIHPGNQFYWDQYDDELGELSVSAKEETKEIIGTSNDKSSNRTNAR